VPPVHCPACGNQVPEAAPACPHCEQPPGRTGRRSGLPVWAKILLVLLLGAAVVGFFAANKPSEAELRQAIRDKAKELQARGMTGPPVLIDDPKYAGRFTYHEHFISSEIKFTTDAGKVITVAHGQFGDITVKEKW
jgi:hypothetical protein